METILNKESRAAIELMVADGMITKDVVEKYFPELKESEDERIRKNLITCISTLKHPLFSERERKEFIAWLEKQGEQKPYGQRQKCVNCQFNYAGECKGSCVMRKSEQKPTDKVEPKFKIGDKIVEKDFGECSCGTIIDIKDGKYIFDDGGFICIEEQGLWKLVKQKPTWSEKDEERINSILFGISYTYSNGHYPKDTYQKDINWLKSLKDRVQPQPKQEWSEEDEDNLNSAIYYIRREPYRECVVEPIVDWLKTKLKSLKERYTWKPSDEQLEVLWAVAEKYLEDDNEHVVALRGKVLESLYNDLKKLTE